MLPLTRHITLSNGIELSTPLLVPSLSSRAVGLIPYQQSPDHAPTPTRCSIIHSDSLIDGIEESLLISAFDIHHEFLADSDAFRRRFRNSRYAQPRLLFIDSGWYEKGNSPIDRQFGESQDEPLEWSEADYRRTIDSLDGDMRPIVVSWDHFGSYPEQIASGQNFFGSRTSVASTMLLKPPDNLQIHDLSKFSGESVANLRAFDIIGVTEREIGESILDRLVNIAQLRRHLDNAGVRSPIHIFGGLDPLYTPLYFAAGGELFDGLGWLRYAYREGVAMHRDTAALLDRQINRSMLRTWIRVCLQNLDELARLSEDLRVFAHKTQDWADLPRGESLEPIFRALEKRLGV